MVELYVTGESMTLAQRETASIERHNVLMAAKGRDEIEKVAHDLKRGDIDEDEADKRRGKIKDDFGV